MSAPAFSSHPSGKREEPSPPWAHLPSTAQQLGTGTQAQGSQTVRCKVGHSRAATSTGPSQPSKEDTRRARPASTQGTEAIPGAGERRAARSILRHTACEDGGSGTASVPRKTPLCPCTILPAQSGRAYRVEAEGKQPHTVPSGGTQHGGVPAPFAESRRRSRPTGAFPPSPPAGRAGAGDKGRQSPSDKR